MQRLAMTAILASLPALAAAQETVGTLSGALASDQISYTILDGDDVETGWQQVENGIEITLEAHPSDGIPSDDQMLRMTFILDAASRNPELIEGDVELVRDGTTYTADEDGMDLTITNAEVSGDSLLLTGNVGVTLGEDGDDVELFDENAVILNADLQATVIRSDDDS